MKVRAFLAFDINEEMRRDLAVIIGLLSGMVKGVKWISPEQMHGTVKFFGEVEEDLLLGRVSEIIEKELKHQSPIVLVGQGVGVFPNWRYPKILWAGLSGDAEAMISLHTRLEEAFDEFGFVKDKRKFRLHLTLGRAKSPLKGGTGVVSLVEKMTEKTFGKVTIDSLTLYKSDLTPEGPIYTVLKNFPLGGGR